MSQRSLYHAFMYRVYYVGRGFTSMTHSRGNDAVKFQKHRHDWRRTLSAGLVIGLWLTASALWACNVPVFRYALENWRPDVYRLTIFHEAPLTEAEQHLIAQHLEHREAAPLNVSIRTVDISHIEEEADRDLWEAAQKPTAPTYVLQYPAALRLNTPLQTGILNASALETLVDSPVRRELVRRLADGQTAVWLMLDSGDAAQDTASAEMLEQELPALTQKLKLPELTDSPEDIVRGALPLRISFSLLRVSRQDAAEQALIAMLLGSELDLSTETAPLVFPVFGRCRALLPLVGAGITAENIRSSAAFLAGACSCQVKELNPGFDLLIAADWDLLLKLDGISLTSKEDPHKLDATAEPVLVPIPGGSATILDTKLDSSPSPAATPQPRSFWTFAIAAAALSILMAMIGLRR